MSIVTSEAWWMGYQKGLNHSLGYVLLDDTERMLGQFLGYALLNSK